MAKESFLKKDDPLFGVLSEDQVGINPLSGRPGIDAEVMEGIIIYLMVANGLERIIRKKDLKSLLLNL